LRNLCAFLIIVDVYFSNFQTVKPSDVTSGLNQMEKLSWSGPTSQHSEEILRDDGESGCGWL